MIKPSLETRGTEQGAAAQAADPIKLPQLEGACSLGGGGGGERAPHTHTGQSLMGRCTGSLSSASEEFRSRKRTHPSPRPTEQSDPGWSTQCPRGQCRTRAEGCHQLLSPGGACTPHLSTCFQTRNWGASVSGAGPNVKAPQGQPHAAGQAEQSAGKGTRGERWARDPASGCPPAHRTHTAA